MDMENKSSNRGACRANSATATPAPARKAGGDCGCSCAGPSQTKIEAPEPLKTTAAAAASSPAASADEGDRRAGFIPGENRRKSSVDRRSGLERRQMSLDESDYDGPERRSGED